MQQLRKRGRIKGLRCLPPEPIHQVFTKIVVQSKFFKSFDVFKNLILIQDLLLMQRGGKKKSQLPLILAEHLVFSCHPILSELDWQDTVSHCTMTSMSSAVHKTFVRSVPCFSLVYLTCTYPCTRMWHENWHGLNRNRSVPDFSAYVSYVLQFLVLVVEGTTSPLFAQKGR